MKSRPALHVFLLLLVVFSAATDCHAGVKEDRRAAIGRAMSFIHRLAADDANFRSFGGDVLWCFYTISHTSKDRNLRESALRVGREEALRWRKMHPHVPANASAREVYLLVSGAYTADLLGFHDPAFKVELRAAATRYSAKDYLGFNAEHESPPMGDPNRYDIWSGALIRSYFGDLYGIRLGATYHDALKWLPQLLPYKGNDESMDFDAFYAITHVFYTLDGYNERRISPALFRNEIAFLRRKLKQSIEDDDPEMVGEAVDCLKASGFEHDPLVRKGMDYLVSSQRDDGTWAGDADDPYTQYHSAWTSIDALRDYRFHGRVTKLPLN